MDSQNNRNEFKITLILDTLKSKLIEMNSQNNKNNHVTNLGEKGVY